MTARLHTSGPYWERQAHAALTTELTTALLSGNAIAPVRGRVCVAVEPAWEVADNIIADREDLRAQLWSLCEIGAGEGEPSPALVCKVRLIAQALVATVAKLRADADQSEVADEIVERVQMREAGLAAVRVSEVA